MVQAQFLTKFDCCCELLPRFTIAATSGGCVGGGLLSAAASATWAANDAWMARALSVCWICVVCVGSG